MLDKTKIKLLPIWSVTDKYPAFYDTESATAIEMVAKIYGSMRELQNDYNNYATEINQTITSFIDDVNADQEEFENRITKIVHDYIAMLDEKIKQQDKVIDDSIVYIKENITESANNIINELIEDGSIKIESTYDTENKKVSLIITNIEGGTEQ